ncbi:MAG: hypothetical protein Q4C96_02870 [Planctomycetia bacterium]|nr:hypothetical protein [Planctomycetia bacterium]
MGFMVLAPPNFHVEENRRFSCHTAKFSGECVVARKRVKGGGISGFYWTAGGISAVMKSEGDFPGI